MNLHLTESSAHPGMLATAEAEREYWLNRQNTAVKAPSEIDVHTFHDALGLMYPLNWSRGLRANGTKTYAKEITNCYN
ncbi:hypothetical protein IOC47_04390 [Enterobacter cloacae]|uniref:hypothetical protein n=1 Tax=Enterobacter cloacae complex TaxID=354276 RepID=UPI001E45BAE9|nr:hypothetical protein [Enterobacter cloacae]MCD1391099.1 hypothetical protein [Enterobacter cloacae]